MGKQVLIVDDSATIRAQVRFLLAKLADVQVTEAANGQEGLDRVLKTTFDVILTDLNMPVLDGFALIRAVRALPHGERIPILVLTVRDEEADLDRAFGLGATGFLTKPLDGAEVVESVRRQLSLPPA